MMLPMILRIRVKNKKPAQDESHPASFNLYIPLLLLYILLIPVYAIVVIVYALMMTAPAATSEARGYMKFAFHAPMLLNAAKGTEVYVDSDDADVIFYIK